MKVLCERERLLHVFQTAASVAPSRSPKPTVQNVKIDAQQDRVTLVATDLEMGVRMEVQGVEVQAPGSALLPIARFGPILRESCDERLTLESDGSKILIHGDRSEFNLPAQNPDEFPQVQAFEEKSYYQLPARFFRELIRRTVFATEPESSRYALGGVLIELSARQITAVATDGHRLAKQDGPAQCVGECETAENTIIPAQAMQLIERALADNDGDIQLAMRENDVLVKSERTTIYSRLLEGRYPRWRDVFPRSKDAVHIELCVGPFHAALRQAAILTTTERRGVDLTFGPGKVVVATHGAEMGEARVEVPLAYDGAEKAIMLNPRFMCEFLRVLDQERMFTIELRDAQTAVVCHTDDGYSYVVMPLMRER